jgi:homoserine kinase type II
MSVYTQISYSELVEFLSHYALGSLASYKGIGEGIENTNYFVNTSEAKYVLTIFEELGFEELPYYLDIMAFLSEHQIPSAHPLADLSNTYLRTLKQKPVAFVQCLEGKSVIHPSPKQASEIAFFLGKIHAVSHEFSGFRENSRDKLWCKSTAQQVQDHLSTEDQSLLADELAFQLSRNYSALPAGIIHADLFRDNALFVGDQLTGIIDFYYACNDVFMYDVAVTLNDWCSLEQGALDEQRSKAFAKSYLSSRSISEEERQVLADLLRLAALRFWLSRLKDKIFPREGEMTHIKDPDVFKSILLDRREHGVRYCSWWDV